MNGRNEKQETDIQTLENLLKELKIDQANINQKIERANNQLTKIKETKTKLNNNHNDFIADTNIKIGDRVRIKNSK